MNSNHIGIIDTHTHLDDILFRFDRSNVLVESRASGVIGIVTVSENLKGAQINLKLSKVHPELLPAAGLFPGVVDTKQAEEVENFIVKNSKKLIAIGEVGLDYKVVEDKQQREAQREIFSRFVELAEEMDLPLNVHSRLAGKEAIDILTQKQAKQVQLHTYDGSTADAMKAVEAGYYFSIPPSIVYSEQKQNLVKKLPLDSILLETNSPVLGPDPDKRNVPANIRIVAETIAKLKNEPLDTVLLVTLSNTYKLYGKTIAFGGLRYDINDFLKQANS